MTDLMPCPFCGEIPFPISTGMAGQPRWQHPNTDTCPIAGHYLGGWNMPEQWNRRTVQAQIAEVQPDLLEEACIAAHNAYEEAAHEAGWVTNTQSRKPWVDVPEANKIAMRAGIAAAIRKGGQP